jgi:hypothetical protein
MKIEVIKGTVTHDGKDYGAGKVIDLDDDKANRLIRLGYAKKAAEAKPEPAKPAPAPEPKIEPKAEPKPGGAK